LVSRARHDLWFLARTSSPRRTSRAMTLYGQDAGPHGALVL